MSTKAMDAYQLVTDKIIDALEQGVVPWHKPWKDSEAPRNLNSGRKYNGINAFLLGYSKYSSPYWMTFKGAQERGGCVKKGEKGTMVVFWKLYDTGEPAPTKRNPKATKKVPLLRYYYVFNLEQTENVKAPTAEEAREFNAIDEAERIIENMPNRPSLSFGGNSAHYSPSLDAVQLPPKESFLSEHGYYGTAFHELVHSTGHTSRLDRGIEKNAGFGSESYSKEELVAEMGAAMLASVSGIEMDTVIDNSAAYIASWLKVLKNDKKFVISAAGKAQKAADYILGNLKKDDDDEQ